MCDILNFMQVELASCKEDLFAAQAALQHSQGGTAESVIPVQSPVGARTFNPVFATEALEGQVIHQSQAHRDVLPATPVQSLSIFQGVPDKTGLFTWEANRSCEEKTSSLSLTACSLLSNNPKSCFQQSACYITLQVHHLQQQLSEERARSASMQQKLEKATSHPSASVSPSKQGGSLCSSPWDELLSHDDSNEENVNPLEEQPTYPGDRNGLRPVSSGSPASQSRVLMSSPAKGGRVGSKVKRGGAKCATAECGAQTEAEARDALLVAVQAEMARLRDVNERLLASQAAGATDHQTNLRNCMGI